MIKYRNLDYINDVDEVIKLINTNLDPDYTRDLLLWKHFDNPFGKSISMVATENEKIVAIVFYMRYNFKNRNEEIIKTIRPLDVCTDKSQRGKGLFKILLEECLKHNDDYDMLFSTPNKKSYPEFIKLGWKPLKRYKFKVGLISPYIFKRKHILIEDYQPKKFETKNLNKHRFFTTATSQQFLYWRFKDEDYFIKKITKDHQQINIIFRLGKVNKLKCIILCDHTGDENLLFLGLQEICKLEKIYIIYYLENDLNRKLDFLIKFSVRNAIMIYKEKAYALPDDLLISLADLEGRL